MKTASSAESPPDPGNPSGCKSLSLWLWVGGVFLAMFLAWGALFLAARSANVERVPLAPKGARP